jgi:ABC-type nitrate/sulfonate/bicarbonate transport system permease component
MTTATWQLPAGSSRGHRRARKRSANSSGARSGLIGVLLASAVLEALPRTGLTDDQYLPPASRMGAALWDLVMTNGFWVSVGNTVLTWAIGLTVALTAASALGLVIG